MFLAIHCSNKTLGEKRVMLFTDEDDPHGGDNQLTVCISLSQYSHSSHPLSTLISNVSYTSASLHLSSLRELSCRCVETLSYSLHMREILLLVHVNFQAQVTGFYIVQVFEYSLYPYFTHTLYAPSIHTHLELLRSVPGSKVPYIVYIGLPVIGNNA